MYNNFTEQDDEFNKMQIKIKATIESMVPNTYTTINTNSENSNPKFN